MKDAEVPRQLEIVKHWYHWMMWGRLGYNPELKNDRFIAMLDERFTEVAGKELFTAWQSASMIYPTTTGFHWGPLDFQWYIEACKSRPGYARNETGFHDVNRFISLNPHVYSGFQSIPDYVEMVKFGEQSLEINPLRVAARLHMHADRAERLLDTMDPGGNRELGFILNDIRTMARLGRYYAHKIHGSTQVALYRELGDPSYQSMAISELEMALEAWRAYTASSLAQSHNPLWTNRVGYVDWEQITQWVEDDIAIARGM
jgi:hypothetical protein